MKLTNLKILAHNQHPLWLIIKKIKNYFSFTNCGKTKLFKLENYFRVLNKINFGELILNSIDLDGTDLAMIRIS